MHVSDQGGLLRARGGGEERVTPLELFFDLVFVFALTQVTGFLVDHLTWLGMLQAAALLMVLWSHRGRVTRGLPTPYQLRR
jgi:low temperature requirement protein LtrA